jgi:membrane protein implicated in regulation of membrane protease activity
MPEATSPRAALPGEWLMRIGAAITITGMVFCLIALAPLATGEELPSWLWWMAMSTGVGLALVLLGLHRAAAARRAEMSAARTSTHQSIERTGNDTSGSATNATAPKGSE